MENNESNIFSYLITNKDFRDWVLDPNDERSYYWKKWMEEHPEAIAEVKKAREFIESMTFRQAELSDYELDDMLEKITAEEKTALPNWSHKKNKAIYFANQWVKVAAILVVCFMAAIVVDRMVSFVQVEPAPVAIEWKTITNPKGRKTKLTLPDSTVVMLNAASEFRYPVTFSDSQRRVELRGEAFFEVARDESKPFIIKTERMTTEVLGTSFNIRAYTDGEDPYIAVVTGKVKVSNTLGDATILRPNEMGLVSEDNNINKTNFDLKQVTGWKDGIISFRRASFDEIQEQLSMWYGVDFVREKGFKMDSVYTGEFVNETLENVMNGIAYSSGFKYKISDDKVYVYSE